MAHRFVKNRCENPMRQFQKELLEAARPETKPKIPRKIYWKAKIFGKQILSEYLWNYYERESEERVPFYLPYIYMKECFDYLRRYAKISRKQISMVLIDDDDARTDYFLKEFLEEFNYLTIVTDRVKYFEGLQERAFQELGLLIDLVHSWEDKNLQGNLVWDFSGRIQKEDCYPEGSVCFMPHKKEWKLRQVLQDSLKIRVLTIDGVVVRQEQEILRPGVAETLLAPSDFPFRETRCQALKEWCKCKNWNIKIKEQTLEKP